MEKEKFIGVTLLFFQKGKNNYTAFLKSYILKSNSWDDLQKEVEQIVLADKKLTYLGIEDIYYVSGSFKENEVLGKSYIDEIVKIKEAKNLLLKQKEYTCNFQINKQKEKWFLFSLLYFYHDKLSGDKLAISCFTAIFANTIKDAKLKIKAICETESFLKKILPSQLDKMSYTNLKYIGIEDISYIKEDVKNGGAIEQNFKKYKEVDAIKELLPPNEKIEKAYHQASNV